MFLLRWALLFVVLAVIAAILGFSGVADDLAGIAKILFGIFVVIAIVIVVLGLTVYKKAT